MSKPFVILSDITCDLWQEWYRENDVKYILHGLVIEGNEYWDDFGTEITHHQVADKLRAGITATTLQARLEDFESVFTQAAIEGRDAIYVGFSSALSGTYDTSLIAAKMVKESYPNCGIYCIDSKAATLGHGLLVQKAAALRDQGMDAAQAAKILEDTALNICHFFTVDDLNHLYRGGRLSKTSALVGSLMGIKPVMYVNDEGKLTPLGKVRGRKASMKELARYTKEYITDPASQIFIVHGDVAQEADELAELVREAVPGANIKIAQLSPIIGVHSGPGTLAIFFWGSKRL